MELYDIYNDSSNYFMNKGIKIVIEKSIVEKILCKKGHIMFCVLGIFY